MAAGRKKKILDSVVTDGPGAGEETYSTTLNMLGFAKALILIEEENVNAIEYQIEVTPDENASIVKWHTLLSWTDLAKDGEVALAISDAWDAVRVGVRSDVDGADGKVSAWVILKRR